MERIDKAVILAAGEGQRLRPFTTYKPKVMIPIANKPILQYVVEALATNGVRHIVVVVGYKKEQVLDFLGSGDQLGVEVDYVTQSQQLGAAHALKQAKGLVEGRFLVLSGDNIVESETIASFVEAKSNSILVKEQENISKYGVVIVKDGTVEDIVEKPEEAVSHLVNTGIYAFGEEIFEFIQQETDLTAVIREMVGQGYRISVQETTEAWLDVVYPWDILRLNDMALRRISHSLGGTIEDGVTLKGLVSIGKDTVIRANSYIVGPAVIGKNCEIGPSVCVLPSTSIGDNVCILPFTEIKNSLVGNNVHIGSSSTIHDSVIDRGCTVKGHFIARSGETEVKVDGEYFQVEIGAMLGEYCNIEDNVIAQPGVRVGNRSRVRALKVLEGNIPDESLVV